MAIRIAVKLTVAEKAALRTLAGETGETVGALIREALYVRAGVGAWVCNSLVGTGGSR